MSDDPLATNTPKYGIVFAPARTAKSELWPKTLTDLDGNRYVLMPPGPGELMVSYRREDSPCPPAATS